MNTREQVFAYLDQHPQADNEELYKAFSDISQGVVRVYGAKYRNPKKAIPKADKRVEQVSLLAGDDADVTWLRSNRKALEAMLSSYKAGRSIAPAEPVPNVEISGPVKVRSYSIAENIHRDFELACKRLGISKRQGVHQALKLFVDSAS